MSLRLAICLLCLSTTAPSRELTRHGGRGVLLELPTDTSHYGDGYAARLVTRLERARANISLQLPPWHTPAEIHVIVQPSMTHFTQRCGRPWFSAGAWLPQLGYICLPPPRVLEQRPELDAELRHEIGHALLHELLPGCPLWFVEGLMLHLAGQHPAQTHSTDMLAGKELKRALASPRSPAEAETAYALAYWGVAVMLESFTPGTLIGALPTICSHLHASPRH